MLIIDLPSLSIFQAIIFNHSAFQMIDIAFYPYMCSRMPARLFGQFITLWSTNSTFKCYLCNHRLFPDVDE